MINTGTGKFSPQDSEEFVEITLTAEDGTVTRATYICSDGARTRDCAKALCELITGFPVTDLFQMNNNAVYYNLEIPLTRDELFCASIAVMAAKKAALDYCKKNNIPTDGFDGLCGCLN